MSWPQGASQSLGGLQSRVIDSLPRRPGLLAEWQPDWGVVLAKSPLFCFLLHRATGEPWLVPSDPELQQSSYQSTFPEWFLLVLSSSLTTGKSDVEKGWKEENEKTLQLMQSLPQTPEKTTEDKDN